MGRNTRERSGFNKMRKTFTDIYRANIPGLRRTFTVGTEVALNMKQHLAKLATVAALAAGMAMAQAPAAPADPAHPRADRPWAARRGALRQRMAQALNLNDAQKDQAKAIFQQAKQNAQPLALQLKQSREALAAAVKANDVAQIHSLAAQQGN